MAKKKSEVSYIFQPYQEVLKKIGAIPTYKKYNADRGAKREFVEKRIVPLLKQAILYYSNPRNRLVLIMSGRGGLPAEIKSIKSSLNNLWKYRPRSTKLADGALVDVGAKAAMEFLKTTTETPFKKLSFHETRKHLKSLKVVIPERTKKNLLVAMAKNLSYKLPKDYFNEV